MPRRSGTSTARAAGVGAAFGETPKGSTATTGRASRTAVSWNHWPVAQRPGLPVGPAPTTPPNQLAKRELGGERSQAGAWERE